MKKEEALKDVNSIINRMVSNCNILRYITIVIFIINLIIDYLSKNDIYMYGFLVSVIFIIFMHSKYLILERKFITVKIFINNSLENEIIKSIKPNDIIEKNHERFKLNNVLFSWSIICFYLIFIIPTVLIIIF